MVEGVGGLPYAIARARAENGDGEPVSAGSAAAGVPSGDGPSSRDPSEREGGW